MARRLIIGWALFAVACGGERPPKGDEPDAAATGGDLVIDREVYDFGEHRLGERIEQRFVVRNSGTADVGPLAAAVTGAGDFSISTNTCAGVLAPSATCEVSVGYVPAEIGAVEASLRVEAPGLAVQTALEGTGLVQVTVTMEAPLRVVSEPPGIDCQETCSALFADPEVRLQVQSSLLFFDAWSHGCGQEPSCTLSLQEQDLEIAAHARYYYETPLVSESFAVDLAADSQLFAASVDRLFKLDPAGEVVKSVQTGQQLDANRAILLEADFHVVGRRRQFDGTFQGTYTRYDRDLGFRLGSGTIAGESTETLALAMRGEDPVRAGLASDEDSVTAWVRFPPNLYLDDTGLTGVDAVAALPDRVLLAAAENGQQRVQVLGSTLDLVDSYAISWDAIHAASDASLIVARRSGSTVTVSRHRLSDDPEWQVDLAQPAASESLVIASDTGADRILVAGLVEGASEPTAWFALLDGTGELQWMTTLGGVESLDDVAINGTSIAFAGDRGDGAAVHGFIGGQ